MNTKPKAADKNKALRKSDPELLTLVKMLLGDPAHQDNPLREPLIRLLAHSETQRRRVERLIKISDRYQNSLFELSESLRESSLHDQLTSLGNRRFLLDRLAEETERANRKECPYTLVMLDVDFFKKVNDQFGHEAGDEVLCRIARAIEEALREYDHCGRWGGEEFLIILPDTTLESATQVTERIRAGIQELRFTTMEISVTASQGMTAYHPEEPFTVTIARADKALAKAKFLGRNRTEVA